MPMRTVGIRELKNSPPATGPGATRFGPRTQRRIAAPHRLS